MQPDKKELVRAMKFAGKEFSRIGKLYSLYAAELESGRDGILAQEIQKSLLKIACLIPTEEEGE